MASVAFRSAPRTNLHGRAGLLAAARLGLVAMGLAILLGALVAASLLEGAVQIGPGAPDLWRFTL